MRYPFALPALALLAGAAVGTAVDRVWLSLLLVAAGVSWAAAAGAFVRAAPRLVCGATAVGIAACGVVLGWGAERSARHTPLRELLDRQGLLSGSSSGAGTLVTIEGTLREDARVAEEGVGLSVAVDDVSIDGRARPSAGGVSISVAGSPSPTLARGWRAGRRVRMPVALRRPPHYLDPGVPDADAAFARRGTTLVGSVKSGLLIEVLENGDRISEIAATGRQIVRETIRDAVGAWSARSAGIVTAILIGDRAGLDASVDRRLQEAGTYHVIAISGGNMAILAGLLLSTLRTLGLSRRGWNVVPIAALIAYAYLVGAGASVSRATWMAVAFLVARLFDLGSAPLNALCVSATIILARSPLALFDAGFVLTFGATFGILMGARLGSPGPRAGRVPRAAWMLLAASLSAETALLPVQASVFSRVTGAGLALNFVAIPLMGVAQIAGMAAVAIEPLSSGAARVVGLAAHVGAAGLVESARLVDVLPWLVRRVPPPPVIVCIAYYAGLGGCLWAGRRRTRIPGAVAASAASWILIAPSMGAAANDTLRVRFLDVGQGDSALVEFPNGRTLLIDTGGVLPAGSFDIGERVVEPVLWSDGIRRLDYLAITHGDPDHMGGAPSVVRDMRPAEIWTGVPVPAHGPTNELRAEARVGGVAWRILQAGDVLEIGDTTLRVWHPPPPDWERQKVRNDDSLVIEIRKGRVSVLLTGDIGQDVEAQIVRRMEPGAITILKVPHHGSLTSSSDLFVEALRPAVAVFSAGRDNRFGHPVPAVLARYRQAGAMIFRTDLDGAVRLETDGRSAHVTAFNGRWWEARER